MPRNDKFLKTAHDRFQLCAEAEETQRQKSLEDWRFRIGEQWPDDIKAKRYQDGRPCLTMNRIPQFLSQITNEQRQQRPSPRVNPVGNGADKETAEILEGIIRHIEVRSDAEVPRDTAFEQMVTGGIGHYRIMTEYDGDGFEQEICICKIPDPFKVFTDPAAVEEGRCDAKFRFIIEDLTPEQYREKYPKSEMSSLDDWNAAGIRSPLWFPKGNVRVAEYYYIEEEKTTIYQLEDGSVVEELPKGVNPVNQRDRKTCHVKWAKINAAEVLDERDIPGEYIPVISVIGREAVVDGHKEQEGLVRFMKDPMRQYNYFQSAATEGIALAPKAPFVMAEGQDEGYEQQWAMANVANFSSLKYKPISVGGSVLGAPQRSTAEPPIQAMMLMVRQADMDLKNASGLTDPNLGMSKADQSGEAIKALQSQGQIANVNWTDNLARSIRVEGKILLGMITHIYDTPRVMRIIDPDGSVRQVVTHVGPEQAPDAQAMLTQEITKIYDLSVGDYDVAVSVGPSYQTKRQQSADSMINLAKVVPQVAQVAGDLLVGNMDFPGADQIAERLKSLLPPQVLSGDDPKTQLAQAQAQLQQTAAQFQQLSGLLQQQHEIIQGKQVENAARIEIEKMKVEAQIAVAEINTKAQDARQRLEWEQEMWRELHGSAHDLAMQKDQQAHEAEQAQQAQDAAAQQQAQEQAAQPVSQ